MQINNKKMWIRATFMVVILFALFSTVGIFAYPSAPTRGYVVDMTNTLSPLAIEKINSLGAELERKSGAEIAVLLIPSIEGRNIEEYGLEVLRGWGIGDREKNNGVLLLMVKDDRKVRLEVGYGLEGAINDAKAGEILDKYAVSYFKGGQYEEGILNTYGAVADIVAEEYKVTLENPSIVPKETSTSGEDNYWTDFTVFVGVVILIVLDMVFFKGRITFFLLGLMSRGGSSRNGDNSRGGFGGGSGGGFGGGSGGGGGASRGW